MGMTETLSVSDSAVQAGGVSNAAGTRTWDIGDPLQVTLGLEGSEPVTADSFWVAVPMSVGGSCLCQHGHVSSASCWGRGVKRGGADDDEAPGWGVGGVGVGGGVGACWGGAGVGVVGGCC